jgi:hypothetical protein
LTATAKCYSTIEVEPMQEVEKLGKLKKLGIWRWK